MSIEQRFLILRNLSQDVLATENHCRNERGCCKDGELRHHTRKKLADFLKVMDFHYPPGSKDATTQPVGIDRSADFVWIKEHGHSYPGYWVALSDGELVAAAETLDVLAVSIDARSSTQRVLIHKIPRTDETIGTVLAPCLTCDKMHNPRNACLASDVAEAMEAMR